MKSGRSIDNGPKLERDRSGGFGRAVVKSRYVILVIAVLLLIPSIIGYQNTKINYDMLYYLPDSMETVKGQDLLLDDFGKGAFSILVTENMTTGEMRKLTSQIEDVDHVDSVVDLASVIDPNVPTAMYPKVIRDNLKNQDASMIVIFFDDSTSAAPTINAVGEIRKICTKDCYLAGMSSMVVDLKNLCEAEEAKYVAIAVVLSLIAMMAMLDSLFAPILFLISIGLAIIYNLGSNIIFGEISYITKAIAAVLQLAVTMDYSIFLWHSYIEHIDRGFERHEAMACAVNATLTSVSGSSLTTIAGFLSMCFMSYTMGIDLGIVMAKGVLLGVISSVTILPALLLLFSNTLVRTRHKSIIPDMSRLSVRLTTKYGIYLAIFALLLIPAVIGYNNLNITYDFTKMVASNADDLPAKYTQFYTAQNKQKEDFDIATTHMIIADADIPDEEGEKMLHEIQDIKGTKTVLGIDSVAGASVPREMVPKKLQDSLIANGHQLILVNSSYNVSTEKCNKQIDEIKDVVAKYDKSAKVIGEGPATKDLINITAEDFKMVSFVSILAVFLIIFFVLQSASLPIILVLAIEFAIYLNMGISGFSGLEVPFLVPVLISTIQLGSTVDYAILMSTRYKTERSYGRAKREAVEIASATCSPSIIVSALSFFAATFGVGLYSNVGIISTLCNMMARGAIISMLTVIFVLPSALMAFDGFICRTTRGLRKKDRIAAAEAQQ
ncbi:MAG: MMPL family transporter [Anaerovoracaceae bacterium]|nr:MMPL family transporter [Anaerovoracaceae bacterium]